MVHALHKAHHSCGIKTKSAADKAMITMVYVYECAVYEGACALLLYMCECESMKLNESACILHAPCPWPSAD